MPVSTIVPLFKPTLKPESKPSNREPPFPAELLETTLAWVPFPWGGWWRITMTKLAVSRLRGLKDDANYTKNLRELQDEHWRIRDSMNLMMALLAGIGVSALAIPGIETSHWLSRAFFVSSTLLSVCAVYVNSLLPDTFALFFAEDMRPVPETAHPETANRHSRLSWDLDSVLLYKIDLILRASLLTMPYVVGFFTAGMIAFVTTASFGAPTPPTSTAAFSVVALAPCAIFVLGFLGFRARVVSQRHRTRVEAVNHSSGSRSRLDSTGDTDEESGR